ncbi:MAG: hypothetical protein KC877_01235 [Candidatus Kaiserbacteria bacterium]|nr:hypothetical protein [Candidatus Kaiserbacteria bacterium]MCB9816528.1 hypothetical protein [Candidatus Nomurabacteria bacterium]
MFVRGQELEEILGEMTISTFMTIVANHDLEPAAVLELRVAHQASISYMSKLMDDGFDFPSIVAAYKLREELGALNDPDRSDGGLVYSFGLSIQKALLLLRRTCPNIEDLEDDHLNELVDLVSQFADACPRTYTWSTVVEIVIDALNVIEEENGGSICRCMHELNEEMVRRITQKADSDYHSDDVEDMLNGD